MKILIGLIAIVLMPIWVPLAIAHDFGEEFLDWHRARNGGGR